jgi:Niemann-Pick C1 protein
LRTHSFIFCTVKYIEEIDIHVTEKYLNGTYGSCKQVSVPSTGQLALDIMCGEWGAFRCSAMRWFGFMGDSSSPFVPFQINYIPHDDVGVVDDFKPLNPKVIPCSQSVDVSLI